MRTNISAARLFVGHLLYLLLCIPLFYSCGGDAQDGSRIKPGVFSMSDVDKLTDTGSKVTRIILKASYIQDLYTVVDGGTALTTMEKYQKLKAIYDSGITIIVTIRWPDSGDPEMDRVPAGSDRTDSLALLIRFLNDFGPIIDIYSIQNEVGTSSAPGHYSEADMTANASGEIPAFVWWQDLLAVANNLIATNIALSHLKIASPAPTLLKRVALAPESLTTPSDLIKKDFFYGTVAFAQTNNIYLDLHLLDFTVEQIESALIFVQGIFDGKVIVTEWSDVASVGSWLTAPVDTGFVGRHDAAIGFAANGITNNNTFVHYTYTNNVSAAIWNDFAALVPGESEFVRRSLEVMDRHGVIYACWALGYQYGEPLYDVRTLFSNKSTGSNSTNTTVYNEMKSVFPDY